MTQRNSIRRFCKRLRNDQRGAVALTFLLTSTVMLGGAFGAIDLVRYNVAQGRLQNALDAAVISAGRNLTTLTVSPGSPDPDPDGYDRWMASARDFFQTNMPQGYVGSSVSSDDLDISYREEKSGVYITGQYVDMSIRGDLPLISTGFLKITSFGLAASNQALRRTRNDLEVVLALDNSGSMDFDSPTRMSVLKTAAKDLTSIILGSSSVPGASQRVYVGLVPFTDVVNVKNYAWSGGWFSTLPNLQYRENFLRNIWAGCIVEPPGNWTNSNPLPAQVLTPSAGFQPLHLTFTHYHTARNTPIVGEPIEFNARNRLDRDRRISASRHSNSQFRINFAVDAQYCLNGRVRFLSNQQGVIESAVDDMRSEGGTGVPVGLQWAWRMLHPAWRGASGWGDPDMPRDPEPGTLSKVIVLLSDGSNAPVYDGRRQAGSGRQVEYELVYNYMATENGRCLEYNWFNWCTRYEQVQVIREARETGDRTAPSHSGQNGQCPSAGLRMFDPLSVVSTNGAEYSRTANQCSNAGANNRIGWGNSNSQNRRAYDAYMAQLCANVKNDGNDIKIYTVTLGSGSDLDDDARALMRNCASGPSYAFNADNVDDLPQVFATIAGALTELRLTQ